MNTDPADYPLTWPDGHDRTTVRIQSKFRTSLAGAMKNTRAELAGFGRDSKIVVRRIVISTNATISNHRPNDPGVAVWFLWSESWHCYAVDLYRTVAENLQAIAKVIEADRVKLRHAGIAFFRSTFKPSSSVPLLAAPDKITGAWRDVFGFTEDAVVTPGRLKHYWETLSKDANGNLCRLKMLADAYHQALAEVQAVKGWRAVIDVGEYPPSSSMVQVNARWRSKMKAAAGDEAAQRELNAARDAARAELME